MCKTNQGQINSYLEEKHILVIYPGTVAPKSSDINQGLSLISSKNKGYLIAKPQVKNKRITESLFGLTAADYQSKFVIITADCLVQISSEVNQINCQSNPRLCRP
jgi:hypothetical protein